MSSHDILEMLPKLSLPELEQLDARLHELLRDRRGSPRKWGEALMDVAGTAVGLPADFAQNHDHYLHDPSRQ